MHRDTRTSEDWLKSNDKNGDTISQWCEGYPVILFPQGVRCVARLLAWQIWE